MADIRVPTLGESVTEATIGKWFKKPGDAVAVDEPIVELENDKVTIEVPAPAAGVLSDIAVKDGETVAVGALLGQMKLTKLQAENAGELFGLSKSETAMLNEVPMRGTGTPMPPTDPLIYRFYELVMINGQAWKALIEEEFGDGIMSAIDFDMVMERLPNPKGDRVKITMSGKLLPYKYYGASGNVPEYGYKEE